MSYEIEFRLPGHRDGWRRGASYSTLREACYVAHAARHRLETRVVDVDGRHFQPCPACYGTGWESAAGLSLPESCACCGGLGAIRVSDALIT